MKFSYSWLGTYVDLPPLFSDEGSTVEASATLLAVANDLTSVGLAVEGRELLGDDAILDIEVTGNRPDCMNHFGIAREIAVKHRRTLSGPPSSFTESFSQGDPKISVSIEDAEGCPRFTARVIRGVKVGPSPEWLVKRLESIGLRSINNVVDATNFVLWETGQPLHAYDLATVPGGELRVRRARAGEKLTTLDSKERKLDPEVLVIADRERAVGLAGIMGGLDTEVTASTRDVLLESAHFERRRTRIGAKRLGLHTDASHRFERGADLGACDDASRRCAALIAELGGGRVAAGAVDARGAEPRPVSWRITGPEIERFGGVEVADAEVERILSGLGFAPRSAGPRAWEGEVPSWRAVDFEPRPGGERLAWRQDVIEEVLRQVGFDAIPATLPVLHGVDEGENPDHDRRERLRDRLAGLGYAEAIHYAFGKRADDDRLPKLVNEGEPVALANPLSELFAVMRRSLVPNLVAAAEFNAHRGAASVKLFESGHLFPGGSTAEVEALALVCGGGSGFPWDRHPESDLFTLKGELEALFEDLETEPSWQPAEWVGIAPGTGARLLLAGRTIGYIGRIAATETAFPLFAAEILLDEIPHAAAAVQVRPPSRFPGIAADLTLTHDVAVSWTALAAAIEEHRAPELASFALKDRYQGAGVPAGAVATTIAFHYNAGERSLTQDEVNARHAVLSAELERRFAAGRKENR